MMYLSRLQLNPGNRQIWRQHLRNPYTIHQMVMRGFPDGVKREKAAVLYRLEMRQEAIMLLVQSGLEPDWSTVEPNYLAPTDPFDPIPNPAVKPFTLPLQANQVLSFRLCANPTIKKRREDEKTGERRHSNRVPLLREEQQLEWLRNRAEAGGFEVLRVTITQPQKQTGRKRENGPITLYTVQFDGHLRVSDPDKLLKAVKAGIGPAKAFGCGLLSLARAM